MGQGKSLCRRSLLAQADWAEALPDVHVTRPELSRCGEFASETAAVDSAA
ncbi:hypothetical protein IG631_12054 [Alternaria alternata]|jgi:hypothetical protein|nr:hypothetical protein IG631_12054 [Alternaria alternata]